MIDKIVKTLAAKYKLDEDIIEKIIRSQFNFVASTMQEGEFQSVHLHYLGKFCVKPNSLKRINDLRAKKKEYLQNRKSNQENIHRTDSTLQEQNELLQEPTL